MPTRGDFKGLEGERLTTLQHSFSGIQYVITDEMSMVSMMVQYPSFHFATPGPHQVSSAHDSASSEAGMGSHNTQVSGSHSGQSAH